MEAPYKYRQIKDALPWEEICIFLALATVYIVLKETIEREDGENAIDST